MTRLPIPAALLAAALVATLAAPALAAPVLRPAAPAHLAFGASGLTGFAVDGYASVARASLAGFAAPRRAVPDLVVDTAADDQPYDSATSLSECTDATAGNCTLREAIEVANAEAALDVIGFDIPGAGVATITPGSPLPILTDAGITIDGYTQPGASPNTLAVGTDAVLRVEIDGTNAGTGILANGLTLEGADQTVRGLVINRFGRFGVFLDGTVSGGTRGVVAGNYIGTDATGTAARPNVDSGIFVQAPNARIGTDGNNIGDEAERNVISGNGFRGVQVHGEAASPNAVVAGNHIGTDATGTADLGNADDGVHVSGAFGARIGTDGNGTADDAEGNRIRANGGDGVFVITGGASVLGNAISGNAGLGIDLGDDGVLANDPDDPDGGANGGQNYPVFTSPLEVGTDLAFSLDTSPSTTFRVELFASDVADPSGHGEGARFLGAVEVTTDASGDASGVFPASLVTDTGIYAATATPLDATTASGFGGTSEFSAAPRPYDLLVDTTADDASDATSAADCTDGVSDGDCSLREAIGVANAEAALDRIGFDIPDAGGVARTIRPTSALPSLTDDGISIDGYTQPGASPNTLAVGTNAVLRVELDGTNAGAEVSGLTLGGADQAVQGLVINQFSSSGVHVSGAGATGAVVVGNHIGTSPRADFALGNASHGVHVNGAPGARVGTDGDGTADAAERNVISANGGHGVLVFGAEATGAVVAGNYVGTDGAGTGTMSNAGSGVTVEGAPNARIGTDGDGVGDAAERNVISGNESHGVLVLGAEATGAVVAGNFIGTDGAGTLILGNFSNGVHIEGAPNARIGTDGDGIGDAAERNVISGNGAIGVFLRGAGATGAVVAGNYVGTTADGSAALRNRDVGVFVQAPSARVGTDGSADAFNEAERNVVSGNGSNGVYVNGAEATGAIIAGNYIGTDATGTAALGNTQSGVSVIDAMDARIGTDGDGAADLAERNVISGNGGDGVVLSGSTATGAVVAGNAIGTDATGTAALGNAGQGVHVSEAERVRIGADGSDDPFNGAEGNVISDNVGSGVYVAGSAAIGVVVASNRIRANGGDGVFVVSGSASVLGNAIAGNAGLGIDLGDDGVLANDPGDPDSGASGLQNYPILSSSVTVGTDLAFTLDSTPGTTFRVELFASDFADPSGHGEGARFLGAVEVTTDASGDATGAFPAALIPGDGAYSATATPLDATAASGFGGTSEFSVAVGDIFHLLVDTAADDQPYVAATSLTECTDATSGNCTLREAIEVANAEAALDLIGFDIPAGGGVATIQPIFRLPFLADAGIGIDGYTQPGASPNTLAVGTDAVLTVELDGTRLRGADVLVLLGPDQSVRGLVINRFGRFGYGTGVRIQNGEGSGAVIAGNYIGTDATGTAALGGAVGISIIGAPGARIGTDGDGIADAAERNVISGNDTYGVFIDRAGATGAVVAGNYIGTTADGTASLGNGGPGVFVQAPNARVGTDGSDDAFNDAERNVLSGNGSHGVQVHGVSASPNAVVAGNYIGTDATGTIDLGNADRGVRITDATNARIGTNGDGIADAAERNVISGNGFYGVDVRSAAGAIVAGNYIGTDATGTAALANSLSGVLIDGAPDARIGTDGSDDAFNDAEGNLISGNTFNGVSVVGAASTGAVIAGNHIGTDATGTVGLANEGTGITIASAPYARIGTNGDGTADAAEGNVISSNGSVGVFLNDAWAAIVAGNYIGTDVTGTADLGNADDGVHVSGAFGARIGTDGNGTADDAEGNRIRANGGDGVFVISGTASVLGNAIDRNGGLGIDLGDDGVLANDPDDPDSGANSFQNYPVLAAMAEGDLEVAFTLDSTPSTAFRVELFASTSADPSGHGEGGRLLGVTTVTTDASGDVAGAIPVRFLGVGEVLTATATSGFGGTSEFSASVAGVGGHVVALATLDGAEGWRMLASPEATTVDGFLGTLWTQGFPGSDNPAGACTVFVFDEAAASFAEGWTCATGASDPLARGRGVMLYVFEDDDATTPEVDGGFPKTLTASTAVNPEDAFAFEVAFTDDARLYEQKGWNLLGVPAGATLDWARLTRTLVGSTVYVYDPAYGGGDYRTAMLEGGVAFGSLPDGLIPSFQGFFVRALAQSPTLVAPIVAAEPGGGTHGRQATPTVIRLALADASGLRSESWVTLTDAGALGRDDFDADRLEPTAWPRAVVYTTPTDTGNALVRNALPADLGGQTALEVPLGIALDGFTGEQAMTLAATADALPEGWTLTLVDRRTGAETPLTDGASASITLSGDASGDAASAPAALTLPSALAAPTALARGGHSRFVLRIATEAFVTAAVDDSPLVTGLGLVAPNPTSGAASLRWSLAEAGPARITVIDLLGREVAVLADGSFEAGSHRAEIAAGRLASGVYVVRLQAGAVAEAARFTVVR